MQEASFCGPPVYLLGLMAVTLRGRHITIMVILKKQVPGMDESALTRFVAQSKRSVRLTGTINVLVTNSRELKRLNRQFLGKDRATDVLSFPTARIPANAITGDIAIAADIAQQNARRLGHTSAEEIKILVLHGMLHLAGYDHERDDGKMAREEKRLRKSLRLPLGLIERNRQTGRRTATRP